MGTGQGWKVWKMRTSDVSLIRVPTSSTLYWCETSCSHGVLFVNLYKRVVIDINNNDSDLHCVGC